MIERIVRVFKKPPPAKSQELPNVRYLGVHIALATQKAGRTLW